MLEDLYIELPNENIRKEVLNNWESVLLPGEDFGILSGLTADYLMMTDGRGIRGLKPVMLLMCGDHGICKYGVSAFPQEVTLQMGDGRLHPGPGHELRSGCRRPGNRYAHSR